MFFWGSVSHIAGSIELEPWVKSGVVSTNSKLLGFAAVILEPVRHR